MYFYSKILIKESLNIFLNLETMLTVLFYFLGIYSELMLKKEFETMIAGEDIDNSTFIKKVYKSLIEEYEIFSKLKETRSTFPCYMSKRGKIIGHKHTIKKFFNTTEEILMDVLEGKLDGDLVRLILTLKMDFCKKIDFLLVPSVFNAIFIQNLMIVCSTQKNIKDNPEYFYEFMKYALDLQPYKVFVSALPLNLITITDQKTIKEAIIKTLIVGHIIYLFDMHLTSSFVKKPFLKFPLFGTNTQISFSDSRKIKFNCVIDDIIDSFRGKPDDDYYLLLHNQGFSYNRICNSNLVDLYLGDFYKSFEGYDVSEKTDTEIGDIDISYLKDKIFKLETKKMFDFVMGLLQYVSCSYKKNIICVLKQGLYEIKIINISEPPIREILDYYKDKKNITNTVFDDSGKNTGLLVGTECLLLSCSHFLDNESLKNYFFELSEQCSICNETTKIEGYFFLDSLKEPENPN